MSQVLDVLASPSWRMSKLIFQGVSGYSVMTTFSAGAAAFISTTNGIDRGTMIFEGIENWILVVGLVIGAIAIPVISYWFKYQDVKKKKEVGKFGLDYAISLGLVVVIGGLVAYICTIFGLPSVCKEIVVDQPSLAFVIALAVGGVCSYLVDTALFHPLADGRVAQKWNKAQEETRKQLASEEAKKLFLSAVENKCKAFGITDETVIQMIAGMVKSEDDPQLLQLIGMFRPKEASPEVIS